MTHEYWYLSRAAGFTAYILLFVSMALGISITARMGRRQRNVMYELHRFTTILALAFTLFHVVILLGDGYFNFSPFQLAVPFASPYRAWQVAAGIFSLYVMGLVVVSFYVRRFIGYRMWRAVHFATFALFGAAALHGITAGTDTTEAWARLIYIGTFATIVGLIIYRVQYRMPEDSPARAARFVAAGATMVVTLLLIFATGLLDRGTSGAGTSEALAAAPAAGVTASGTYPFLDTFATRLAGTYTQSEDDDDAYLVIDSTLSGDLPSNLHVELAQETSGDHDDDRHGDDDHDGEDHGDDDDEEHEASGAVNTAVLSDPVSAATLCAGTLTALHDGTMRIACEGQGPYAGVEMALSSQIQASRDGTLTGEVQGAMHRTD